MDLWQGQLLDAGEIILQLLIDQLQVVCRTGHAMVYRFSLQHLIGDDRQEPNHQNNNRCKQQNKLIDQSARNPVSKRR
ncbi:hypothetical protein D3C73_1195080 [compost metagenome]